MKKILILCILITFAFKSEAQTDINNYKYIVIPLQYEFLKGKDTYRLNTVTRVLFKGEGFDVYFNEEQLPEDLFNDRCKALYADVKEVKGGFRKTKLEIILKDCNGKLVLKSDVGQSGENNHEKRHREALADAFKSIEKLNYSYKPKEKQELNIEEKVAVKNVEEKVDAVTVLEIEDLKREKEIEKEKPVVKVETKKETEKTPTTKDTNRLIAKSIPQGFQILNAESKIVMTLLKTAAEDVYIVKGEDAIVFKSVIKWMYSANDGTSKVSKELDIKF
ncbi:hypothetical protein [Winogradskyella sp. MIT101101]|uniref:hypothetical protein n=1 Tax=Winogradskyella sp. MIT101101 TaxID=3098297 RepID=UPI00399AAB3A